MKAKGFVDAYKLLKLSMKSKDAGRLAFLVTLVLLTAIGFGLLPMFFQRMLAVASSDHEQFLIFLVLVIGVVFISQVLSHSSDVLTMMFIQRVNINLGEMFIKKSIGLSANESLVQGPAHLAQVLQCASASMDNTVRSLLVGVLPSLVQILVSFVVLLFFEDFFVMFMIFLYVFVYAILSASVIGRLSELFKAVILKEMGCSKTVHGIVSNIETIRIYLAEEFLLRFFREDQEGVYQSWLDFYRKSTSLEVVRIVIFSLVFFVVIYESSLRLLSGEIGVGHLVMVAAYMFQVCQPYDALLKSVGSMIESLGGFAPLLKHFDACEIRRVDKNNKLPNVGHGLEFCNVGFSYPNRPVEKVLCDLSIRFAPGEVVAITGPSGVGKSTIVKLLMRLYVPSSGLIKYGGVAIGDLSDHDFYSRFSFVSQEVGLFNGTLRFNLKVADQNAPDEKLEAVLKLANLEVFLKGLPSGLDTEIGDRGLMLSGGERQRLALARSFLRDHKVVVFDESTAFLDEAAERTVISNIKKYNASNIVIIVAHRESILKLADRVVSFNGEYCVEL
ncbi:ABC transporter ATP-binding protein [Pseudomonas sp. RA_105y_Pfl2_P56]|uniref:ABC transporter ATP-binding protein n=1 Tax=Pseudomonas sp. RA_105y_Pfl2_P56 TaxID=3088701 RepID=UPI0030DD30B1